MLWPDHCVQGTRVRLILPTWHISWRPHPGLARALPLKMVCELASTSSAPRRTSSKRYGYPLWTLFFLILISNADTSGLSSPRGWLLRLCDERIRAVHAATTSSILSWDHKGHNCRTRDRLLCACDGRHFILLRCQQHLTLRRPSMRASSSWKLMSSAQASVRWTLSERKLCYMNSSGGDAVLSKAMVCGFSYCCMFEHCLPMQQ